MPSRQWMDERRQWRRQALRQVQDWIEQSGEPYDVTTHNVVVRRVGRLELFIRFYFPKAPATPFAFEDAAALIVLPRSRALKLARKLFRGGPGIASDLRKEDLRFNMDWFIPEGWSS